MSNQQVKSVISYDYYYDKLHFCQPEGGPQTQSGSLGSILFGDRIFTSPFEVIIQIDTICLSKYLTREMGYICVCVCVCVCVYALKTKREEEEEEEIGRYYTKNKLYQCYN